MAGQRIYFPAGTSDQEREAAAIACVPSKFCVMVMWLIDGWPTKDDYIKEFLPCTVCGCKTPVWASSYNRNSLGLRRAEAFSNAFPCPLCHPNPNELDAAGRIELARALAQTDALTCMHALLDQAVSEGRTTEEQWHNPGDLAKIATLEARLVGLSASRRPQSNHR